MTDDTATRDWPARYEDVRAQAAKVNAEIRIIVAHGKVTAGQEFTLKPFEAEALELGPALDRIEEYVGSERAAARGELYRKRDEAEEASKAALDAWQAARRAARKAQDAVAGDLADELDEGDTVVDPESPVTLPAGTLRGTLSRDDPAEAAVLDRIADLPDDALVRVEPDGDEIPDAEPGSHLLDEPKPGGDMWPGPGGYVKDAGEERPE